MIVSVNRLPSTNLDKYDTLDNSLIPSKDFVRNFGDAYDYIEAHLYTKDGRLLRSNYNVTDYLIPKDYKSGNGDLFNSLELFPDKFIESYGYTVGSFKVQYNIFRKKIVNSSDKNFFIKEISSDRLELKLSSNSISDDDIQNGVLNFIYEIQSAPYFKDFLINFGDNKFINAVNIALDKSSVPYSIIVKLYQPLPSEFDVKSSLWIVEELSNSYVFEVDLGIENTIEQIPYLKPANFNIEVDYNSIQSSDYININGLFSTNSTSSYQKVLNELSRKSVDIPIDYSDYSNFIHFSSAKERLLNFVYKLSLIEGYNSNIYKIASIPSYTGSLDASQSIYTYQSNINDVVKNFDGYEKYLYNVSSSASWPKSGSYPNYYLYPTTSSIGLTWLGSEDYSSQYYGGQIYTASIYDSENQDNLIFSVPEFIVNDQNSESYLLFLNMIGQHFDNIWLYSKAVTDLYKNTNAFATGISKDLVYNALRSLGIKLYNSNSDQNIFEYLLGSNVSGSYIPTTSSYYTTISASAYTTSGQDQTKELFKRVYHNLPFLLKTKGTKRGVKALISTFGISDSILDVVEYGGSEKFENTSEYSYDRFSYSLTNTTSSFVYVPWYSLRYSRVNGSKYLLNPDTIEFRIKPDKNNIKSSVTLLQKNVSSSLGYSNMIGLKMDYTSSNSIPSANVTLIMSGSTGNASSSLLLPIYVTGSDGDSLWWNFMLKRRYANTSNDNTQTQYYDLYVKNHRDERIGNQASCSIYVSGSPSYNFSWNYLGTTGSSVVTSFFGPQVSSSIYSGSYNFIGQVQEIRYWIENVSESVFDDHVLNPFSIEGNISSSAYENLSMWFPLGNDLRTYNNGLTQSLHSVHPKYNNQYLRTFPYEYQYGYDTASFYTISDLEAVYYSASAATINFVGYTGSNNYASNYEVYYTKGANSGYYTPISDKIRISNVAVSGNVLSPFLRQEQPDTITTKDTHFTDISFSPQSQIDKDIIANYGNTINIDNLIGDPSDATKVDYPNLTNLRNEYYQKYFSTFNYKDFVRLISFFDNSLFKMIRDYTPARSNVSTGITIKPTILERAKVVRTEPIVDTVYDDLESEITTVTISSGSDFVTNYGDGRDYYNGEFSGSVYDVYDQIEQNNINPYTDFSTSYNQNLFDHSDYNVLLNNVSGALTSHLYQEIDKGNSSVRYPAILQDYYYEYRRHILPRYLGSKSTSHLYNFYTNGDASYGKNAAIDKNVAKFAFINQVNPININFYDKTTMNIKYLIDASGSTTDLSRRNYNIFEVQNTFVTGDDVTVSLLDPFNPTNQTELEGNKHIWLGGYSFSPILFREINENLQFNYISPTSTVSQKLGIKAVMTSSVRWEATYQIYPNTADGAGTGGYPIFEIGGVRQSGKTLGLSNGTTVDVNTWMYQSQIPVGAKNPFISNGRAPFNIDIDAESPSYWISLDCFLANSTGSAVGGYGTSDFVSAVQTVNNGVERYAYYVMPRSSEYTINMNIPLQFTVGDNGAPGPSIFKIVAVVEKKVGSQWQYLTHSKINPISVPAQFGVNPDTSDFVNDDWGPDPLRVDCYINNFVTRLDAGDQIRARLYIVEQRRFFSKIASVVVELIEGSANINNFEIYDNITSAVTPINTVTIPSDSLTQGLFRLDTGSYNTLIFSDTASVIYNNTRFSVSGSSIPERYSDVVNDFHFEVGDYVRFGSFFQYNPDIYYVTRVIDPIIYNSTTGPVVSQSLQLVLDRQVSVNSAVSNKFAILRRTLDETCVILSFNKSEGQTSSGILIPYNILPAVKDDVGNIIGPLKQQLLANVLIL